MPFGDLAGSRQNCATGDVAGRILRPVQGHGVWAAPGYLAAAAGLLHKHGALLICDEEHASLGRSGTVLSYQHDDVQPDIVTVAKALSSGYVPGARC